MDNNVVRDLAAEGQRFMLHCAGWTPPPTTPWRESWWCQCGRTATPNAVPGPAGLVPNCTCTVLGFSTTCGVFCRTKVYHSTTAKHTHTSAGSTKHGSRRAGGAGLTLQHYTPKTKSRVPQASDTTHRPGAVFLGCLLVKTHALHSTHRQHPTWTGTCRNAIGNRPLWAEL